MPKKVSKKADICLRGRQIVNWLSVTFPCFVFVLLFCFVLFFFLINFRFVFEFEAKQQSFTSIVKVFNFVALVLV